MLVTIVDYNVGNIRSISNMIKKIGYTSLISSKEEDILKADKLIIPGVGSFDYGMNQLSGLNLIEALNYKANEQKTPILGICLGAQLFTKSSEEGQLKGLGWFDAETVRFNAPDIKIPHMSWSNIQVSTPSPLLDDLNNDSRFYFVHSYHFKVSNPAQILTTTHYGYDFASGLIKENIYGVQFHPEKSHKFGMTLLKNFMKI